MKITVRCFRKNTPKNQTEFKGIEAIYIVVVVVLTFTFSFFNYFLFYFLLFIFIFLPSTFSGTHVRTVRKGSYAPAKSQEYPSTRKILGEGTAFRWVYNNRNAN